ncbi:MAG: type II toxin-antitoxin system HicB family antitoxin [Magnetococcales bacterium]|nr:type II toxin-antitoxin system HicB family antitoxin [Magnetococcales bacterium]
MKKDLDYPFTIRHLEEEEGSGFIIEFPDLPDCMSDGENMEEAIKNGREAMLSWLKTAKEEGREIPDPY